MSNCPLSIATGYPIGILKLICLKTNCWFLAPNPQNFSLHSVPDSINGTSFFHLLMLKVLVLLWSLFFFYMFHLLYEKPKGDQESRKGIYPGQTEVLSCQRIRFLQWRGLLPNLAVVTLHSANTFEEFTIFLAMFLVLGIQSWTKIGNFMDLTFCWGGDRKLVRWLKKSVSG